jgi:hypothetical protein
MVKMLLINMSGHPLSQQAQDMAVKEGLQIQDIQVPNVDITMPNALIDFIKASLKPLVKNNEVQQNQFQVIPPGMSILTVLCISALHGISGCFPKVRWLIKDSSGIFVLSQSPMDLQDIRLVFRGFR